MLERIATDREFSHRVNGEFVRKVWYKEEAKRGLAIQPDSSALNAVIEAAAAPLREAANHLLEVLGRVLNWNAALPAKSHTADLMTAAKALAVVTKESGAPSGQTAGVASQKAGQP